MREQCMGVGNGQKRGGPLAMIAALSIAAALAGPAAGQDSPVEARTGEIHQDCERFSSVWGSSKFELRAWCRISDGNTERKQTSVDLASDIGKGGDGRLQWGGRDFHRDCRDVEFLSHVNGLKMTAECIAGVRCSFRDEFTGECMRETYVMKVSSLELAPHYRVNSAGELEVR